MTHPPGSVRIRRTQKLLREALVDLIEDRGFETITVGEITDRALVSRAAFYRNYRDKYDLVEQIFAEAMGALRAAVGELGKEHPAAVWVNFFAHIAAYDRLYRALLSAKGSPWFARNMRAALADLIATLDHNPYQAHPPSGHAARVNDSFAPDMVAALFVEAITWWLVHHQPVTPTEIATRTARLAAAIFQESSAWQ